MSDESRFIDAAFRRAVVGMAITDAAGYYVEVNDAMCSLLGYSADDLLRMSFHDVTAPEDLGEGTDAMRDLAEARSSEFRLEKRYVSASGDRFWARTTGMGVRAESGNLLRVIVQIEDLTAVRAAQAALDRRDSHDQLTDLVNRNSLYDVLDAALRGPRHAVLKLALLVVNLDRFDRVNAGLGHAAGDFVLREASRRITAVVRGGDTVARIGADEFAVLAPGMRTPLDVVTLALDIRHSLGRAYWPDGHALFVSARVGVVTNVDGADGESLLQMASAAAEQAKSLAGGWALHTEGADTSTRDELGLVNDLRLAVEADRLTVAYQPVVDRDGNVSHLEALARWSHPERGAVPADQFIVLAEQNGLISELTDRIMTSAIAQATVWRADSMPVPISVNLSGKLLAVPKLAEHIRGLLDVCALPAASLTLEITETALAEGNNVTIRSALEALRSAGVRISIDDFGTGYSSLSYLKQLPVDEIKIDRSFVLDLDSDVRTERIVRSIIDLAHSLDLTVVAEGVETDVIAHRLGELGADFLQGFAIARPAGHGMTTEWLQTRAIGAGPVPTRDTPRGLEVLVVDSEPSARTGLRKRLRQSNHRVARARDATAAMARLQQRTPDLIILDHHMPGINGVATAPRLRQAGYSGPILLLSGSAPDELAATRFPMDVWPVSTRDEALLIRLIDGYAVTATATAAAGSGGATAR